VTISDEVMRNIAALADARRRAFREAELAALDWIAESKQSDHWHPESCQVAYVIAERIRALMPPDAGPTEPESDLEMARRLG
jgi:hypothetical protein